jgi:hypothetical protein
MSHEDELRRLRDVRAHIAAQEQRLEADRRLANPHLMRRAEALLIAMRRVEADILMELGDDGDARAAVSDDAA